MTPREKGAHFRQLHHREGGFVLPNPWDAGSASLLTRLGFEALGTTSAGCAFSRGTPDNLAKLRRATVLENAAEIVRATDLPVSGDLANGWRARPEDVAVTIEQAASVGLVGGSIEDATGESSTPIYDFELAVDRVHAAADAVRRLNVPFTLTARAEGFLLGRPDLDDTIRRLQAFQEAGADVLYAPGLRTADDIASVVASIDRPLNVVVGVGGYVGDVAQLRALGVQRISLGSSLYRTAFATLERAAREVRDAGTFGFIDTATPAAALNRLFDRP